MRNHQIGIAFAFAFTVALVLSLSPKLFAQTQQPSKTSNVASSGQAHDLSGIWMQDRPPATAQQYWVYEFDEKEPSMTAWGKAKYNAAKSSFGAHPFPLAETTDPVYHGCTPPGLPRIFLHPFPLQIVQVPGEVIMLFEYDSVRHQIFTDGRPHDTSLGPLWMGDSIGHWEGDALVADTVNFNDRTWLDRIGHPHSDALHLVERIRRINHDHLIDDLTIDDPKTYAKPWTVHLDFLLRPKWTLTEQFCEDQENFQNIEKTETAPAK
jgi:hypothetical protein